MALEFILKLQDYMTPRLGAAARAADTAVGRMNQRASANARNMGMSMDAARRKVEELRAAANRSTDWRVLRSGLREAAELERRLDRLRDRAEGRRGGLTGMLGGALKPLLAAASVGAVMSFSAGSVKAAMDFGATSKSYEVLAGDAAKGRGLANNLNRLQQDTILGPEVFKAGQTLMSFGMSAERVMPVMKQLGDVSMGNSQRFEALTLAFAQTQSVGKLMGQDLLQYVNAGFNPLQTMSEKWKEFGFKSQMSVGQLRKAMEKGEITSQMVAKSFEIATSKGGKFADMMDTIATTSYGKMKVLEGQYENFKINIGNALMPVADSLMTAASKTLDWLNISKTAPEILSGERGEINTLVKNITELNEKNELRGKLIGQLIAKYPEFFGKIDRENTSNGLLLLTLNKVNDAYEKRLQLANSDLIVDTKKKEIAQKQSDWVRKETIAKSLDNNDIQTAKALMTPLENVSYFLSKAYMPKSIFAQRVRDDATKDRADAESAQGILNKEQPINDNLKLADRFRNYYALAQDKNGLASKIPDAKNRSKFLELANKISFKANGATYTPGGVSFADKMEALLNGSTGGGSLDASGISTAKATAERAMSGQKEITINITRLGVDKFELHTNAVSEGIDVLEQKIKEMFLRVVNSATGLAAN